MPSDTNEILDNVDVVFREVKDWRTDNRKRDSTESVITDGSEHQFQSAVNIYARKEDSLSTTYYKILAWSDAHAYIDYACSTESFTVSKPRGLSKLMMNLNISSARTQATNQLVERYWRDVAKCKEENGKRFANGETAQPSYRWRDPVLEWH